MDKGFLGVVHAIPDKIRDSFKDKVNTDSLELILMGAMCATTIMEDTLKLFIFGGTNNDSCC